MEALINFCTFDNLVGLFLSLVLVPFFLPTIKDGFCNCFIWFSNWRRGRATFRVGERYNGLILPSGYRIPAVQIVKVDFKFVVFASTDLEYFQIKKSDLVTGKIMPIHYSKIAK